MYRLEAFCKSPKVDARSPPSASSRPHSCSANAAFGIGVGEPNQRTVAWHREAFPAGRPKQESSVGRRMPLLRNPIALADEYAQGDWVCKDLKWRLSYIKSFTVRSPCSPRGSRDPRPWQIGHPDSDLIEIGDPPAADTSKSPILSWKKLERAWASDPYLHRNSWV